MLNFSPVRGLLGWKADVLNERTGEVTFGLRLRYLAAGSLEELAP
jgi:hypothetical protein